MNIIREKLSIFGVGNTKQYMKPDTTHSPNSKEQIIACYSSYIKNLSAAIDAIGALSAKNKKFKTLQNSIVGKIEELLTFSRLQLQEVMYHTVWDKLVIAFFGETGAGKSTIIETFRIKFYDSSRIDLIDKTGNTCVDGLIVGDGRQDFTQEHNKYQLEIDGCPFIMIDVPGMDGKEGDYLDEIGIALKQAHCIFYIHGHNKKPDAATASKIKSFLSDWVDVYSIYNVRGGASDYDEEEERSCLINDKIKSIQESTISVFQKVIPDNYKGNITCQGLLALLSVADFHPSCTKLINDQKKLIKYFGDKYSIEKFSQIDSITELVKQHSKEFHHHILEANNQKLLSLSKRISNGINDIITTQDVTLNNFECQLNSFRRSIKAAESDVISTMTSRIYSEITQAVYALKRSANDIIDSQNNPDDWSKKLERRFTKIGTLLEESLHDIYCDARKDFQDKVEEKRKDIDKILHKSIVVPEIEITISIDTSKVIECLRTHVIEDVITQFFEGITNPIRTILNIFSKDSFDDGRLAAKREIGSELQSFENMLRYEIEDENEKFKKQLSVEVRRIIHSIDDELKNIKDLRTYLGKLSTKF